MITALMLCCVLAGDGTTGPRAPAPATPTSEQPARARWTLEEILIALRVVETGGERNGGRRSTGDGGSAIGPYQIHRAYWLDARVPGRYEDCRDPRYARAVVIAYWRRYCPKALETLDAETLVRTHNGGPDGSRETCTLPFWKKIERELVRARVAHEAAARKGNGKAVPAGAPKEPRAGEKAKPASKPEPKSERGGWV